MATYGDPSQMYDPFSDPTRRQALLDQMPGPSPQLPSSVPTPGSTGNTGVAGGIQFASQGPAPAPFNYQQARDSWMSGQYGTGAQGAAAWAQANGVPYSGGDTITLPNGGGQIDIIGNYGGGSGNGRPMTNNWTPAGGNGPAPGGNAAPAPASVAPAVPGLTPGSSGAGAAGATLNPVVADYGRQQGFTPEQTQSLNDFISQHPGMTLGEALQQWQPGGDPTQNALRKSLISQMDQYGKPFDPNSASFQAQWNPIRNTLERLAQQEQGANAEQAAYAGANIGGGAGGTIRNSILENLGQREAGAQGQLIGTAIQQQIQQLQSAMSLANSLGARDQATALQQRLADLENQYRYAALAQQNSQFGQSLGQQQGIWNDQYGLNRAQLEQQQNRDALLAALGG